MTVSPAESFGPTAQGPLRRLSVELFALILVKIALLALIWWLAFAPQPKPDTSPGAIAQRLAPTSQTPSQGQP
ncbi:cytochrome oxidase putative small subunit CydP [Rhodanobacter umsongensis]